MDPDARYRPGSIRLFPPETPPIPGDPDGRLSPQESSRLRAAAHHAKRAYPGPIGELLARELTAYADFGYRFAAGGLFVRLADDVLGATHLPAETLPGQANRRPPRPATGRDELPDRRE